MDTLNSDLVDLEMATASPKMFLESMGLELELAIEVFDKRIQSHYRPQALSERKRYLEIEISEFYQWQAEEIRLDKNPSSRIFEYQWQEIQEKEVKLKKVTQQIQQRKHGKESDTGITDDMISRAKDYPIESLVEVGRGKMVSCPAHDDKKPSCYIKNNFAYCFSCQRSRDVIQWAMDTESLNFVEAVRRLQ